MSNQQLQIKPQDDFLCDSGALAVRWRCDPATAMRRVRQLGLPIVRFNRMAVAVWFSDVVRAKQEATRYEANITTSKEKAAAN